jgi:hypothetical protein
MAHFAELDQDNKVMRVVVACNNDIANNGGELSEQAANHFATVAKHSFGGVKWVQTSYNDNFRKRFASTGATYDPVNDVFIAKQPFLSWTLDSNFEWKAPITRPLETDIYRNIRWDEINQRWTAHIANSEDLYIWNPNNSEFIKL